MSKSAKKAKITPLSSEEASFQFAPFLSPTYEQYAGKDDEINLIELVQVVWAYRFFIIAICLLGLTGSGVYLWVSSKYVSQVDFIFSSRFENNAMQTKDKLSISGKFDQQLQQFFLHNRLQQPRFLNALQDSLNMEEQKSFSILLKQENKINSILLTSTYPEVPFKLSQIIIPFTLNYVKTQFLQDLTDQINTLQQILSGVEGDYSTAKEKLNQFYVKNKDLQIDQLKNSLDEFLFRLYDLKIEYELDSFIKEKKQKLNNDHIKSQLDWFDSKFQKLKQKKNLNQQKNLEFSFLQDELTLKQLQYQKLKSRLDQLLIEQKEIKIHLLSLEKRIEVLSMPTMPSAYPSEPKILFVLVIGVMASLFAAIALVILTEFVKNQKTQFLRSDG